MLYILHLFRRKTEDLGVWRGGRCLCPPGIYSVNDLPRMVRTKSLSVRFIITHFIFSFTPCMHFAFLAFHPHPCLLHRHEAAVTVPSGGRSGRQILPTVRWYGWAKMPMSWRTPALSASSQIKSQEPVKGWRNRLLMSWHLSLLCLVPPPQSVPYVLMLKQSCCLGRLPIFGLML